MNTTSLTPQQLAAVLAGLRLLQRDLIENVETSHVDEVLTDGGSFERITSDEVDDLCELINHPSAPLTGPAAMILQAAQQMHDAADKLHSLLGTSCAVHARIMIQSLGYIRLGADDLQQFAGDLADDQRAALPLVLELDDAASMAEELADKAARRAVCTRVA